MSIHGRDDDGLGYIGQDDATDLRDREMESLEARIQVDVSVASPRLVRGSIEPVDVTAAVTQQRTDRPRNFMETMQIRSWTTMLGRRLLREAIAQANRMRGRWSRAGRTPGR